MDRKKNSVRNTVVGTLCHLFTLILGFVTRTFLIYALGKNYLGINGLFSNILSMLSFAELGIGTAITFSLYKPIAENNEKHICALMNFYRKAYFCIAIFIAVVGILLVPFLNNFIKGQHNIKNLEVLYVLTLTNVVIGYIYSYKRTLLLASQNSYINSLNVTFFSLVQNILQIIALIVTKNYVIYLLIHICITLLSNISISIKTNKLFPFLRLHNKEMIDKNTFFIIAKNVVAMMSSKLGSVIVSGTDNLLISMFVGIELVGIYSNYVMIYTMVNGFIMQLFNAITASVGNLNATSSKEHSYNAFKKIFFINFCIMCFCSVNLLILYNHFVTIWAGSEYLLSFPCVVIIVINFYIYGMRQTSITYINTYGLFWQIKYKSIVEAMLNILFSLLFLKKFHMGIYGVLLGTTTSTVCTNLWWEPYVVYKYEFSKSLKNYFTAFVGYSFFCLSVYLVALYFTSFINVCNVWTLIIKLMISCVCFGVGIIIVFGRTESFKFCLDIIKKYILNILVQKRSEKHAE